MGDGIEPKVIARPAPMLKQTGFMGKVALVHQSQDKASRIGTLRQRLTIDVRRHGPALTAIARSRRMSTAALARTVLDDWLKAQSVDPVLVGALEVEPSESIQHRKAASSAKLTLRMPADPANQLARQARAAELSQGMYVAQLVDAQSDDPLGVSPRALVAALVRSNAKLAALNSGLKALARKLKQTSSPELAGLDALVAALTKEVGQHLAFSAPQIAAVPASWRRPALNPN